HTFRPPRPFNSLAFGSPAKCFVSLAQGQVQREVRWVSVFADPGRAGLTNPLFKIPLRLNLTLLNGFPFLSHGLFEFGPSCAIFLLRYKQQRRRIGILAVI